MPTTRRASSACPRAATWPCSRSTTPTPTRRCSRSGRCRARASARKSSPSDSALGVLSNTVTRGIVSAVRKAGPVTLIQTDAAINPGNSGGPLVNRAGQVIGINSLRAGQQAEGVAFAVAIDHATQLLNGERVTDTQTPLGSLTQMLDGRSDGDQQRARGEQEYGRHTRGRGARGLRARFAVGPLRAESASPPRRPRPAIGPGLPSTRPAPCASAPRPPWTARAGTRR